MLLVPVQALASPYGKVGARAWCMVAERAVTGTVRTELNAVKRAGTGDLAGRDLYLHPLPEPQSEHWCADGACCGVECACVLAALISSSDFYACFRADPEHALQYWQPGRPICMQARCSLELWSIWFWSI